MSLRGFFNFWFWSVGLAVCLFAVTAPPLFFWLYSWISNTIDGAVESRLDPNFAPTSDYGLVPVEAFNPKWTGEGIDLIFVHGLGSNPDTTWEKANSSYACEERPCDASFGKERVNWVTDFLPDDLPDALRQRTRAFFFNYNSYWQRDASWGRRRVFAQELLHEVFDLAESSPNRTFIFVGHSYGGLVIKEALVQSSLEAHVSRSSSAMNLVEKTAAIMFLGTPHRGSKSAWLGTQAAILLYFFGKDSNIDVIKATQYDSLELQDMHRNFEKVSGSIDILNLYEKRKLTRFRMKEHVVSEQSAALDRSNAENLGLDTDHVGLNKFEKRDSNYKTMRRKLIKLMERATQNYRIGKSVFCVPEQATKYYVERPRLYSALSQALADTGSSAAVVGRGGTGKTQLVLRYATEFRDRYNTILWIDARTEISVVSSFYRCSQELGLSITHYPSLSETATFRDNAAVHSVLRWLEKRSQTHGQWLLIIDNADEITPKLASIVPHQTHGNIIITSRDTASFELLPGNPYWLTVRDMEEPEAASLILRHLNVQINSAPPEIRSLADTICRSLQYFPLAIHLAGAQIRTIHANRAAQFTIFSKNESNLEEVRVWLESYLKDLEAHRDDILRSESTKGLSPYHQTVWTVWDTSLDALDAMFPNLPSRQLLAFLSHIDAIKIPNEVFHLVSKGIARAPKGVKRKLPGWLLNLLRLDEDGEWDAFSYSQALVPLQRFGLIDYHDTGRSTWVIMHSLIQWRAMLDSNGTKHPSWSLFHASLYATIVDEALDTAAQHWWRDRLAVDDDYEPFCTADDGRDTVMAVLAVLRRLAKSSESKEGLEAIFQYCKIGNPPNYMGVACLPSIAPMRLILDLDANHETSMVIMILTRLRRLKSESPFVIISYAFERLIDVYIAKGRYSDAERLQKMVIKWRDETIGEEDPQIRTGVLRLALISLCEGRLKDAEEYVLQAIESSPGTLSESNYISLATELILAMTYAAQHKFDEAEALGRQVVETSSTAFGRDDVLALGGLVFLISLYGERGQTEEAKELLRRVDHLVGGWWSWAEWFYRPPDEFNLMRGPLRKLFGWESTMFW